MHMRKCAESQFSLLFLLAFIWKKATLNESSKIYSSSSKIVLPKAMSFFKQVLSAVLLQLVILQQVGSQNQFETHYKTLIGNLEGETLQHIYDHVTIKELRENAESFSETVCRFRGTRDLLVFYIKIIFSVEFESDHFGHYFNNRELVLLMKNADVHIFSSFDEHLS